MLRLSSMAGLRVVLSFLTLGLFAPGLLAATIEAQLQVIAEDVQRGVSRLEAAATSLPASASDRERLDAGRGLLIVGLWSDAGFAPGPASESQTRLLLPELKALAERLDDKATLSLALAYEATVGYWTGMRLFDRVSELDRALDMARASGNHDAICLTLVRKGESGWASFATPQWAPFVLEAARLERASPVCRAYATFAALSLNAYLSGLSPLGAASGLEDGRKALALIAGRDLVGLEDRLNVGMLYIGAMQTSASASAPTIATAAPDIARIVARARQRNDGFLLMSASVFQGGLAAASGDAKSALKAMEVALGVRLAPPGQLAAVTWAVHLATTLPGALGPQAQDWVEQAKRLVGPGSAPRYQLLLHQTLERYYAAVGDFKLALESSQKLAALFVQTSLLEQGAALQKLKIEYDTQAKELENERLRATEAALVGRRNVLAAGLGMTVLGLAVLAWLWREQWLQRRKIAGLYGQLETLNKIRSELLAAACHDLRQPAFSLSLLTEVAARDPQGASAHIEDIRRNSLLLSDMLSELLDLSRLESADYPVTLADVHLQPILDEVASQYEGQCRRKGLVLRVERFPYCVRSDPQLLRRIIFNLVSNAVKYTMQGEVVIHVQVDGDMARLRVKDTGRGMPASRIQDMLRPYTRMDHADREEGLGIGLSVVNRATQRLGHALNIESEPGRGTTVTVELGAAREPGSTMRSGRSERFAQGTLVAVVDDNDEVRDAMTRLLQGWGLQVEQASSGAQLEARIDQLTAMDENTRLSALVTDYAIGSEDGLELARRLRSRSGYAKLPVLMVTGSVSADMRAVATAEDIVVLLKPTRPSKLRNAIDRLLRKSGQVQDA